MLRIRCEVYNGIYDRVFDLQRQACLAAESEHRRCQNCQYSPREMLMYPPRTLILREINGLQDDLSHEFNSISCSLTQHNN